MKKRAAIYIRLSKEESRKGGGSLQTQRELLLRYAREHHFTVAGVYCDEGRSGVDFKRPALLALLQDIERSKIDVVLTKDLSRLGRNSARTTDLLDEYFPQRGVRYISVSEGVDTQEQTAANGIVPIANAVNELYARDISQKIRSSLYAKMQEGQYIGSFAPYGYRKKQEAREQLEPDTRAAQVVNRIFTWAAVGRTPSEIACRLEREQYCTPLEYRQSAGVLRSETRQYHWQASTVRKLLKNPCYVGMLAQGRSRKPSFKAKKSIPLPKEQWYIHENRQEAIVSQELYERVQALLHNRRRSPRDRWENLFAGMAWCADCGARMSSAKNRGRYYLICGAYKRQGRKACTAHRLPYDLLYREVEKGIQMALQDHADRKEAWIQTLSKRLQREENRYAPPKKQGAKRQLHEKLRRLYDDKYGGHISKDLFEALKSQYEGELCLLEQQAIPEQARQQKAEERVRKAAEHAFAGAKLTRAMLYCLIERIEVRQGEEEVDITVKWKKRNR